MKFLYLHGLGQKPDSWDRVIKETTVSDRSVRLSLAEMLEGKAATYKELYTAFSEKCNKENDEIVLCGTMTELDFRDSLCKVSCPALIVCGEKDNANKKASKELASYLSDSHFHELLKAGHEANMESPEELATVLQEFYDNVE